MISIDDFLGYRSNKTGKVFLIHKITVLDFIVFNTETGEKEKATQHRVRTEFTPIKEFHIRHNTKKIKELSAKAIRVSRSKKMELDAKGMKTCFTCKVILPKEKFLRSRNTDLFRRSCISCELRAEEGAGPVKACTKCKEEKEIKLFPVNDYGKPQSWCKECINKKSLEKYYEKKALKELGKEIVLKDEQAAS